MDANVIYTDKKCDSCIFKNTSWSKDCEWEPYSEAINNSGNCPLHTEN